MRRWGTDRKPKFLDLDNKKWEMEWEGEGKGRREEGTMIEEEHGK